MNEGKFDGGKLSKDQKILRSNYSRLLNLCNQNEALQKGRVFDVHAYNLKANDGYSNGKVFSFIKSSSDRRVMVICHFGSRKTGELIIKIPKEYADISWETGMDILNDRPYHFGRKAADKVVVSLAPHQSLILEPGK
jgi:hypothetical protein